MQPLFQTAQHFYEKREESGAGAGSVLVTTKQIRMRIQEAQKHTDPTDPDADPEHWVTMYMYHMGKYSIKK